MVVDPPGRKDERMSDQNIVREKARVAKAKNPKDFPYSVQAEFLGISITSLYNWMNEQYNLKSDKATAFESWLDDILE